MKANKRRSTTKQRKAHGNMYGNACRQISGAVGVWLLVVGLMGGAPRQHSQWHSMRSCGSKQRLSQTRCYVIPSPRSETRLTGTRVIMPCEPPKHGPYFDLLFIRGITAYVCSSIALLHTHRISPSPPWCKPDHPLPILVQ